MTALPAAATLATAATGVLAQAAEAAGNSLMDSGAARLAAEWPELIGAVLFGLMLARVCLPWLQSKAAGTATAADDTAVQVLRWLVGGAEDRLKKDDKPEDDG